VNGIYLGYSELKSNYTNQSALKNGRRKVIKDYFEAIRTYHQHFGSNDTLSEKEKECYRKDFLKIFEKAIHITTTDIGETFVIRTISANLTVKRSRKKPEVYLSRTHCSNPMLRKKTN